MALSDDKDKLDIAQVGGVSDNKEVNLSRKISSLADPRAKMGSVVLPDTTKTSQYVDAQLENMNKNVLSGYESLVSLQTMRDKNRGEEYTYRLNKGIADANAGAKSSSFGQLMGEFGKALLDGYTTYTSAANKRLEVDNEIKSGQLKEQQRVKAEEAKRYYDDQTENALYTVDQIHQTGLASIQKLGYEEGSNVARQQAEDYYNSPEIQALPPESQGKIRTQINSLFADIDDKKTENAVKNQQQLAQSRADIEIERLNIGMSAGLAQIKSGSDVQGGVDRVNSAVESQIAQIEKENGGEPVSDEIRQKLYLHAYKQIAIRVGGRTDEETKNNADLQKYSRIANLVSAYEEALAKGAPDENGVPLTRAGVNLRIQQELIKEGMGGYKIEDFPNSNVAISKEQLESSKRLKELDELRLNPSTPIDPDSPAFQKGIAGAQGEALYRAMNNDPGSNSYLADVESNPNKYPANERNVPGLVKEYKNDRKEYQKLGREIAQLEQRSHAAGRGINDENKTSVEGQQAGLLKEAQLLKSQQEELRSKWLNYGNDIANPADRTALNKLLEEGQPATMAAQNNALANQGQPAPAPSVATPTAEQTKVINTRAIDNASRRNRPELYDENQSKRKERDIGEAQRLQASVIKSTGDETLGRFVANQTLAQYDGLDKYEKLIREGKTPQEAYKTVLTEYNSNLETNFTGLSEANQFKDGGIYPNGVVSASQQKDAMKDKFKQRLWSLHNSNLGYRKQFGAVDREAVAPTNANPSERVQKPSDNAAYATTPSASPSTSRNVGQSAQPAVGAFASSQDNLLMPVPAGNSVTATPIPGNGGNRPSGLRITSTSNQVVTVGGGTVYKTGSNKDGKFMVIKTPDGRYEFFGGLEQLYYKPGDKMPPGKGIAKVGGGYRDPDGDGRILVAESGKTGVGSGAHLDIRGRDAQGNRLSEARLRELANSDIFLGDGKKPLSNVYKVTSGYGHRDTGIKDASTYHEALDYGAPEGTKVYVNKDLIESVTAYDENSAYSGGGGNVVVVKLKTGETLQFLHLKSTNTFDAKPAGFNFAVFDSDPYINGEITSKGGDVRSYLLTQKPSLPNTNGQVNAQTDGQPNLINGMYELAPGVYLISGNRVFDMKTGEIREYKNEKKGQYYARKPETVYTNPPAPNSKPTSTPTPTSTSQGTGGGNSSFKFPAPNSTYKPDAKGYYKSPDGVNRQYNTSGVLIREDGKEHKGLDIFGKVGDPIVSPFAGTIVYAETGHTVNKNEDSNPNVPGRQEQHSAVIKLDQPMTINGKTINYVYMTHFSELMPLKPGQRVEPGTQLGKMGVAGNAAHSHITMAGDVSQKVTLNEGETYQVFYGKGVPQTTPQGTQARTTSTPNTGTKQWLVQPRAMSIYKPDYVKSGDKIKNNPDENYGYDTMAKDRTFSAAVAKGADELGIPAVWLVDIMAYESDNFNKAKHNHGNNHFGLIGINTEWLAKKNITPSQLASMSLTEQFNRIVIPYLKEVRAEQGGRKGYDTVEDVAAAIHGGGEVLRMSVESRKGSQATYTSRLGRFAGRRYNTNYDNQVTGTPPERMAVHTHPRGNCPFCQQLTASNAFQPHPAMSA